jgi:hypothetical protein
MRTRDTIKDGLQRKGFELKEGSDHWRFIYFSQSGAKTSINTKISRGSSYKTLSDNLLEQMYKKCKLTKSDFTVLINCPLSREQYESKLRSQSVSLEQSETKSAK